MSTALTNKSTGSTAGRAPRIALTTLPRVVPTADGRRDADKAERGMIDGVLRAGGVPVILPIVPADLAAAQLEGADGLVLAGGQDLDAGLFGGQRHPSSTWVDPERDRHELGLWRAARRAGIPALGVCRGLQLAAAAEGGAIEPHVTGHDAGERFADVRHRVEVVPGSRLGDALGASTELQVNTIHHQVVCGLPPAWRLVAQADDGTVEAAESTDGGWFLGVQWHPELMLEEPAGQPVFDALVGAARSRLPAA
jgi:putative glutamine amidotransferase